MLENIQVFWIVNQKIEKIGGEKILKFEKIGGESACELHGEPRGDRPSHRTMPMPHRSMTYMHCSKRWSDQASISVTSEASSSMVSGCLVLASSASAANAWPRSDCTCSGLLASPLTSTDDSLLCM